MRRRFIVPFLLVGALLVSACGASSAPTVETLDLAVDDTAVATTAPAPLPTARAPTPAASPSVEPVSAVAQAEATAS